MRCGAHVTIIDDFSSGDPALLSTIHTNIRLIEGSICDRDALEYAMGSASIIFHAAARASVPGSWHDPADTWSVNVAGTYAIYEAARHAHSTVVFSSSAAVYGNHEGRCTESLPARPCSPYGLSKKLGEELGEAYAAWWGVTAVSLRYFNVYGPRPYRPGVGVVNELWNAVQTERPITLRGDGQQTRDFIFVDDVALANLIAGASAPRATHSVYNVGTGTSRSLTQVLTHLTEKPVTVQYCPAAPGDIRYSEADCSRLMALIR